MYSKKANAIINGDGKTPTLPPEDQKFDFNKDNVLSTFEQTIKNAYDFCHGILDSQNVLAKIQSEFFEHTIKATQDHAEKNMESTQKHSLWTVIGAFVFLASSAIFFLTQS